MSAVKVLLAGDCLGGFSALFKRVATVNNKSGPFDLLICVGQFFAEGDDEGDIPEDLQSYVNGTAQLPVPTYFIGACGRGSAATLAALSGEPAGQRNLHYLGRSGVRVLESLNVAFLDGTYNHKAFTAKPPPPKSPPRSSAASTDDQEPASTAEQPTAGDVADTAKPSAAVAAAAAEPCRHYNQADVAKLRHQLMVLPGEVDMLLSCEWPAGLLQQLPEGQDQLADLNPATCSSVAADIAATARPRYHIAGGQGLFYARIPYANPDIGAGQRATRFVGLGSVTGKAPPAAAAKSSPAGPQHASPAAAKSRAGIGMASSQQQQQQGSKSAGQQKFLHALGLPPAALLTVEQLGHLPEGCGPCPYQPAGGSSESRKRAHEHQGDAGAADPSSWRWMQPKKHRGAPGGGPAFQPWGRPGVEKDSSRSVFVKNLPFEATYDDLANFFSQAGQVEDIRRGAQQDTGRPNPWCHVQFTEAGAVSAACALNGSLLLGRELTIATSTPLNKPDSGDGLYRDHKGQQRRGQQHQQPFEPGKPVEGCWFCLSSDQVDINLVASVGEEVYLALDKGPITSKHCLIIPIEHYPSWAALPAAAAAEAGRYLSALRTAAAAEGQQLVGFERFLKLRSKGGNHCHINTVGISKSASEEAADVFQQMIQEAGLTATHIPAQDGQLDRAALQQVVGEGEYFLGVLPDGSGLAAPLIPGQRAPMQLGRQILAKLAGVPERADWKECTSTLEQEKEAADAFRDYFKPYDVTPAAD